MNSKNRFIGFIKSIGYNVKNYQVNGFEWCYNREKTGGGLLCYEMGLGKTILMLSCIKLNPKIRTLIVLPKALISQWVEKVRVILNIEPYLYTSSLKFKNMDSNTVMRILNSQSVIITSYGMITERVYKGRNISSPLWKIKWSRVIYDEAHNMRNSYSKLYMGAMKINSEIFWMMTGTPIQNRWGDVVSLCMLSKIKPLIDGIKSRSTEKMISLLKDYMLYNTKKNVNIKMPKLNLHIHKIPFKNQEKDQTENKKSSKQSVENKSGKQISKKDLYILQKKCNNLESKVERLQKKLDDNNATFFSLEFGSEAYHKAAQEKQDLEKKIATATQEWEEKII